MRGKSKWAAGLLGVLTALATGVAQSPPADGGMALTDPPAFVFPGQSPAPDVRVGIQALTDPPAFVFRGQSPAPDGQVGTGQTGAPEYAPPDTIVPLPIGSTHPEAGGLYVGFGFLYYRQTNDLKGQTLAVRGFVTTNEDVLGPGTVGTFVGSRAEALNVNQVTGENSFEPGFNFEVGWKFADGSALTFGWKQLSEVSLNGAATLFPKNYQVGNNFENSFLTAFVYNFPPEYNGPTNKLTTQVTTTAVAPGTTTLGSGGVSVLVTTPGSVSNNGAAGIWNGATVMDISFIQRFQEHIFTYRMPIYETDCYRFSGLMGARHDWIWERFMWRTVDYDVNGASGPQDVGIYTNIVSNEMYGAFIGSEQEWYWGHGFAGILDLKVSGLIDDVAERAKYELGTKYAGPANKRARRDLLFVPECDGSLGFMWYPIEAVQVKLTYDAMLFLNTIGEAQPVDFNYGSLDPTWMRYARLFDGFQAVIAFNF